MSPRAPSLLLLDNGTESLSSQREEVGRGGKAVALRASRGSPQPSPNTAGSPPQARGGSEQHAGGSGGGPGTEKPTRGAEAEGGELVVSGRCGDTPSRRTESRGRSGSSVEARIASRTWAAAAWRLSATPAVGATLVPTRRKGVGLNMAGPVEDGAPGRSAAVVGGSPESSGGLVRPPQAFRAT